MGALTIYAGFSAAIASLMAFPTTEWFENIEFMDEAYPAGPIPALRRLTYLPFGEHRPIPVNGGGHTSNDTYCSPPVMRNLYIPMQN
ncbi:MULTISPECIES: hypothetical protein [unclassified Novosphingobium]|uniref:hypothetical protein n=1 Tax=unclassified Novosphingobium TaxID=2644732 RepID=UPI0025F4DE0F|nr:MULTISPECIES: hypothetical protein [unclassified Novosphingobium]HQS68790.1 hypothetical protein [Novosphingobium sp.]